MSFLKSLTFGSLVRTETVWYQLLCWVRHQLKCVYNCLFFHNKCLLIYIYIDFLKFCTEILKLFDPKRHSMVKMLLRKNRFWTRFSGEIGVPSGTGLVAVVLTRQHGHGDDRAKSDGAGWSKSPDQFCSTPYDMASLYIPSPYFSGIWKFIFQFPLTNYLISKWSSKSRHHLLFFRQSYERIGSVYSSKTLIKCFSKIWRWRSSMPTTKVPT